MQPSMKPSSFFLLARMPVPSSASPPIGNSIAKVRPVVCGLSDAVVAAVVETVKVEVPVPLVTEAGLNAQVGCRVAAGVTAQVRFTVPVKPFTGAMVMVDVAAPPGVTVAGVGVEATTVKSGTGAAVTVKVKTLV